MPEDNIVTHKVGPLPLVIWVAGGAGVVFLFIMLSHKGNSGGQALQTNQLSTLAPTEAEAFGTIEQQQQDVTNALTTLGNNQSYLGGSIGSLSGQVTQQGLWEASQFQNVLNGQSAGFGAITGQINQVAGGINDQFNAQNAAQQNYYNLLAAQLASLLGGQQGLSSQLTGVSGQVSALNQTVTSDAQAQALGFSNLAAFLNAQQSQIGTVQSWVNEIKARLQQGDYSAPRWGPSGQSWTTAAQAGPSAPTLVM